MSKANEQLQRSDTSVPKKLMEIENVKKRPKL